MGTLDSTLRLWDITRGKSVKVYKGHENRKFCLFAAFATFGGETSGGGGGGGERVAETYVLCGSEDHGIYVWDLQTKQVRPSITWPFGHSSPVPSSFVTCRANREEDTAGAWGSQAHYARAIR
jgi:WD40 repeat protein